MGRLLDNLLGNKNRDVRNTRQFETISEPSPMVATWDKKIYEQQLMRSCIDRIAISCSKLEPKVYGTARPRIKRAIETSPNQYQSWSQFLYRAATIYYNDTNLFIIPCFKDGTDIQTGWFTVRSVHTEIVDYYGEPWIRFHTPSGKVLAIELYRVALMTRFQYESDFFGTPNNVNDTLALLEAQQEAQKKAIADTGRIQFIAAASGQVREEDMEKKRDRFAESNLSEKNTSGLMVYDTTFTDVKQVEPKNWTIPTPEMERLENSVFDYFGLNRDILQNRYDENAWDAFYEGVIEPWAIQLGEVLSQSAFTMRERPANRIEFSANRLAYMSAASKRNMIRDLSDRGFLTQNQAMQILQLPELGPAGDLYILRGEYKVGHSLEEILAVQDAELAAAGAGGSAEKDIDESDKNIERPDTEGHGGSGDTDSGDATTNKQDRWD